MFHDISESMTARMRELEERAEQEGSVEIPNDERLRQISPDTGKFLALLAASSPEGSWFEFGTSAGYSAMWLSLAARVRNQKLITADLSEFKAKLCTETFKMAGIEEHVDFVFGDGMEQTEKLEKISFYFLDTEKSFYEPCYELVVPKLVPGGLLIADNTISHADELQGFLERAEEDPRVDAVEVPIGKGILVCRKV